MPPEQWGELMKVIGFRKVAVHDNFEVNDGIVQAIAAKKQYGVLEDWMGARLRKLDSKAE